MADKLSIFNDIPVTTESWTLQGAVVLWQVGDGTVAPVGTRNTYDGTEENGGNVPLLMNQISVRYAIPVSNFTPLNTINKSAKRVIIKGVPEGTLTVQSIFTPDVQNFKEFIAACQSPCRPADKQVTVSLRPFGDLNCEKDSQGNASQFKPGGIVFYLRGLDLRQFDFSISQQDQIAMTNMPLTFQFFGLEIEGLPDTKYETGNNEGGGTGGTGGQ